MGMDFTVISPVRHRFGDEPDFEQSSDQNAPFVGAQKSFLFSCPKVDPRQMAVLQFESLGVGMGGYGLFPADEGGGVRPDQGLVRGILILNDVNIPAGITPGPGVPVGLKDNVPVIPIWKTHSLVVDANVLKEKNELFIEAREIRVGFGKRLDNFVIDNIVIFYKTL